MKKDFFRLLMVGLATVGMSPAMVQTASGAEGQVLNIAHPVLDQNWSPLQGGGHVARWQSLWWAAPMYFERRRRS